MLSLCCDNCNGWSESQRGFLRICDYFYVGVLFTASRSVPADFIVSQTGLVDIRYRHRLVG
jgi:hypothetical protein